ncbi:MAG: hypothetical protein ACREQN_07185 [Candidatus Binataceae bacterium]
MPDQEQIQKVEQPVQAEQFTTGQFVAEVLQGAGVMAGLGLLWALEVLRDACFHLLDRLNVRPRARRGRPFPPGHPRKHQPVEAEH